MARLLAIALLGLLPSGLAGPACAQKYKDASDCIQRCSTKWGFPGLMMGNDPWGSVMQTTGKTIDDFYLVIAKACGEENATTTTADASTSTSTIATASSSGHIVAHGGLATHSSSSVAPTSTPSRFVNSTRITTSATTHSTTTSSTPKPTPAVTKPKTSTTSTHTTAQATHTAQSSSDSNSGSSNSNSGNSNSNSGSSNSNSGSSSSNSNSGNSNSNSGSSSSNSNSGNSNSNSGSSSSSSNTGSSSSGSSGNGSRASDSDVQAYLTAHNTIRAQHGAVAVTWSNDAAVKAQEWADKCLNKHSGGTLGPLGENLAAGTGTFTIAQAVKAWTDEVSEYDPNNPQPSHFTQVVWKATTQIGCAVQTCDGIFPGFGAAQYYVCEYSVQGNVIGEFGENVQA